MPVSRRSVLSAGAAIAALPLLPRTPRAAQQLTLSHAFGAHHQPMLDALVQRFMEAHPDLAVEAVVGGDNWSPLLQTTLRQGLVGDLPDLSHQSLTFTRLLHRNGLVQPLDPLFGGRVGLSALGIAGPMLEPIAGHVYAVPFGTTVPVVYYNRDLMRQAGVAGEGLPETWPGIFEVVRKVAALGGSTIGGYIEYTADNGWMFQNLVAATGGRLVTPDDSDIAFDDPVGLEALRVFQRFGAASGGADMSLGQARQAFNAGTMGVLIRSASGIASVGKAADGSFTLDIGSFPVPSPDGRLVGAGHGLVIFAEDPERQRAASEYLKFAVGPEGQSILAGMTGYLPINQVAFQDPQRAAAYFEANPYHRPLIDRLSITSDWYTFPNNSTKIFDGWIDEVRAVILQRQSPEQALDAMAGQARRLMKDA